MENLYKIYTFRRVTSYFYGNILLLGTSTFAQLGMACTLPKVVFLSNGGKSLTCSIGQAVCNLPNMENRYTILALLCVTSHYYGSTSPLEIKIRLLHSKWGVLYLKLCFYQLGANV